VSYQLVAETCFSKRPWALHPFRKYLVSTCFANITIWIYMSTTSKGGYEFRFKKIHYGIHPHPY